MIWIRNKVGFAGKERIQNDFSIEKWLIFQRVKILY